MNHLQLRRLMLLASLTFVINATVSSAQGTAFTYQGRLNDGASGANGTYDVRFAIYDAATSGTQQGPILTNSATAVSNGLFTVTLDFGNQFPGASRWLEIGVRTNGSGAFSTLAPRQSLTPTPYAIRAANFSGPVAASQLTGTILSDNFGASSLTTFMLAGGAVTAGKIDPAIGLWTRSGSNIFYLAGGVGINNSLPNGAALAVGGAVNVEGTVSANAMSAAILTTPQVVTPKLGTAANVPLELWVNNQRAVRIQYATSPGYGESPNIVGGYEGNTVSNGFVGATIFGGGYLIYPNRVGNDFATVLGGAANTASGVASVAMGFNSLATGGYATAMGRFSTASGGYATAMGSGTHASGSSSTAMGDGTTASGYGSLATGSGTTASGFSSTAMGYNASANHQGSFVWADTFTTNQFSPTPFGSTANNQFLIRATGGMGIGTPNPQGSLHVYSTNNPTVVRVQSTGTPGFGRLEFVSNPQGDVNEWRPGYIQSTDNGGFIGGLAFFVNGAGAGSKFGNTEVMRVVNGAVGIGTPTPVSALQVVGTVTATAFNPPSDRNLKENFAPVSPCEVLEKVAAMPISRWNFKGDSATPHVGPMAQDFHAAFGLGTDERHIATVDADGVALAAIQGLNQKLEQKDAKIAKMEQELAELKQIVGLLADKLNGGVK